MPKPWKQIRDEWKKKSSLSVELSSWALTPIDKNEAAIKAIEDKLQEVINKEESKRGIEIEIKKLKRAIKNGITSSENSLDDISLNSANSFKLQISVPSNLNYLMKVWAASEGRDLSSVALQCLEIGLREMKGKGAIPKAAIERYDISCEKRIALAEVNEIWNQSAIINNMEEDK